MPTEKELTEHSLDVRLRMIQQEMSLRALLMDKLVLLVQCAEKRLPFKENSGLTVYDEMRTLIKHIESLDILKPGEPECR